MNGREYIITKQINWALNRGIKLIGSEGDRGRKAYTPTLDENLFEALSQESINQIESGDGGELSGDPAKMQAVHSSSALGINIFHYWIAIEDIPTIAYLCGFCRKSTRISSVPFHGMATHN